MTLENCTYRQLRISRLVEEKKSNFMEKVCLDYQKNHRSLEINEGSEFGDFKTRDEY